MSIILIVIGVIFIIAGLVGCIVPVLPGPPISYISLILISWAYHWKAFSTLFLILMGIITIIVALLDYLLPIYLPKRYGASKYAVWGSAIGLLAGLFFLQPFGFLIGAFLGAVLGELIFKRNFKVSLKAGLGVFTGTIASTALKLGVSTLIGFYFFRALVKGPLT